MENLIIAMLQTDIIWENPSENKTLIDTLLKTTKDSFDLLVLPEMFTTGFTMNPENVAEDMNGETVLWMKSLAIKKNCAICGSLVIKENGNYFNLFIFAHPNGTIDFYNKRHLFSLAGEHNKYTKGKSKVIIDYLGWKICPQVCYDLRFPVFSRNVENYDVLIYVANWPKVRIQAWNSLLKARSIENLCYTIGVNRIGNDDNNHEYNGQSQVIDELGNQIINASEKQGIFTIKLDKEKLHETRNKLNFLNDRDDFNLK